MRIAVVNWTRRAAGGAETTMALSLGPMARAGHHLAFWYEIDRPSDRPLLQLPEGPSWCAEELGREPAVAALRDWKPEVLYVHGLLDPATERRLLAVAPGVLFAHNYYGTCISGNKTLTFPRVRPCPHRFGWKCLLRYYPRRTGGLNPATMISAYRRQARRLTTLRDYRFLVVLSAHMRSEYLQHGFPADRVVRLPFPWLAQPATDATLSRSRAGADPWRLLFVGRMDPLKGGAELLRAAVEVARSLAGPIQLTMVGDGPSARRWRDLAGRLAADEPRLSAHFPGWIGGDRIAELFSGADLLVMPSLWPEPFGRTGLEAAAFGVPCVGYAVGGIPEWLTDGVNGHLASGD
ncbi:MAG: glycosyltransferase family 4 protein, partial [Gemmatimonadetes bacterium]|nr:glycosyltransferase family 4 protein [Gemmatimonadota bacterium]